ncbi:transposase InsO family protein [Spirosoma lacussanchae]
MYLMAIIDLHSRYVLVWSVSSSMDAGWCSQVLRDALGRYPAPTIFNTDKGCQFTSEEFTSIMLAASVQMAPATRLDGWQRSSIR